MSWRRFLNRAKWDRERREEIVSYVQMEVDANVARGMRRDAAEAAARRKLGNTTLIREEIYRMNTLGLIDAVGRDVRYAFRSLRQNPVFTTIAIATLALGIGANTAIFGVVNTFLIRPLPFKDPDRLAGLRERDPKNSSQPMGIAIGNFLDWQQTSTSFEQMSAIGYRAMTLSNDTGLAPERVVVCQCSANLFATLGITPILGRAFRPEEDKFDAPRVAVIGYNLWQRAYGGSADVIGKSIRLDGQTHQIIGVTPRGFMYPHRLVEVWRPLLANLPPAQQTRRDMHSFQAVARIAPGVSREQANTELNGIAARYKAAHPEVATGDGAFVIPLHDLMTYNSRRPLLVLLGAVGCVLLIACVNIASLLLTRAAGRAREIGIRSALGAGRARLIGQLITESTLVALAGGAIGAILAIFLTNILVAHAPSAELLVPAGNVPVDPIVFLFAFGLALITGVAVGLYPAIRVSRTDLAASFKETTRSTTAGRSQGHFRNVLVSAEVALSMILLVGSGLLLRSFFLLYQVNPGVRVENTLTMAVSLPLADYRAPARRSVFLENLRQQMANVPGVSSAGLVSCAPVSGVCNTLWFYIEGRPFVKGKYLAANELSADPEFFKTAAIPLLRGRVFNKQDGVGFDPQHPKLGSIVISESMAKAFFPNENPIGKRIFFDFELERERAEGFPAPRYEIVGVVGDVLSSLDMPAQPHFYRPLLDLPGTTETIVLHTAVEPHSIISAAREQVRKIDANLAINRIQTIDELLGTSTADRQFSTLLLAAFAGLALLLASIGLYGVVSYAVSQRTSEIGIRMALGATGSEVNRMVLFQGLRPAFIGLLIGAIAAAFACQVLRNQLFGIRPLDPLTFAAAPVALLGIAVLACYVPAARASRLDPTVALRTE